jgi:hypothetical protein
MWYPQVVGLEWKGTTAREEIDHRAAHILSILDAIHDLIVIEADLISGESMCEAAKAAVTDATEVLES